MESEQIHETIRTVYIISVSRGDIVMVELLTVIGTRGGDRLKENEWRTIVLVIGLNLSSDFSFKGKN